MCGIVGFTGSQDNRLLHKMCQTLTHRGPDDEGYFYTPDISLGMRRLEIIDLKSGQQPISNETKQIWIVFNGEIYNHQDLRNQLIKSGHVFRTDHSDTEVIVHLYEEYGENFVTLLNGMFGIAIWDGINRKLILYRDRLGKKPIYYTLKQGQIIFASEIKALLAHPSISKDINYEALYHYFGQKHISAPNTIFSDINQLLPGHFLIWKDSNISSKIYWQPDFTPCDVTLSESEAANELFKILNDSVKIRMQCDVPFGAYLSGGLDSSAITSLMSMNLSNPVITFCLGYEDTSHGQFSGKKQDIKFARMMSKRLRTEHHEFIINANKFTDMMPDIINAFDEPFSGTISTYFLSILIAGKHIKVAISGDGADELFGSYLTHRLSFPIYHLLELNQEGKFNWNDLDDSDKFLIYPFTSKKQFQFLKSVACDKIPKWRDHLSVFTIDERQKLLNHHFFDNMSPTCSKNIYNELDLHLTAHDPLNKTLEIDQKELLPNQILPFVDRLSMAHSIEVRCPYLDHRFVETANQLPGKYKIMDGINKYILTKTIGHLLPDDLIKRPKEGFVQPIYTWMHGELKPWIKNNLRDLPSDIFHLKYIDTLIQKYEKGDAHLNAKIWNLVCFNIWYQLYIK